MDSSSPKTPFSRRTQINPRFKGRVTASMIEEHGSYDAARKVMDTPMPIDEHDYAGVARALEAGIIARSVEVAVAHLMGYKADHDVGAWMNVSNGHWRWKPNFRNTDDALEWICVLGSKRSFDDLKMDENGRFSVSLYHPDYGNDYGNSFRLSTAMWAAFVKLYGKVGMDDD